MEISANLVKELRNKTGAGVMECKKALIEAEASLERATEILKQQGFSLAEKKTARHVGQGVVEAYIHAGGRVGALVEVNCETDFVARTEDFRELAHNLALQVTAMAPQFVSEDEIPAALEGEPAQLCLLSQPFIKDNSKTVHDIVTETIAKTGENIKVRRFTRFELGF